MNFTNILTKINDLDKPIQTLTEVKETVLVKSEMDLNAVRKLSGINESVDQTIEECGMPPMSSRPETPVTMNVSMNASGTESIRDLLDILKGADLDDGGDAVTGPAGLVVGISKPGMDRDDDMEIGEENLSNEPDEQYADVDAVTGTGNDLHSHGDNEVEKVNGGGNPYTNVSEQLKQQLKNLYSEVKSR